MPKAVRFDQYGALDVLQVAEVERPTPLQGDVLVRVKAAGINPSEAGLREGFLHSIWPATFPSGEGTDFSGIVAPLITVSCCPAIPPFLPFLPVMPRR